MYPVRTDRRLRANYEPGPVREMDGRILPRRCPADRRAKAGRDVGYQSSRFLGHCQGEHLTPRPSRPPLLPLSLYFPRRWQLRSRYLPIFFVSLTESIPQATPYHYKDCGLIIGDAAHSQVPFYGQGLNCGLEDVRVLDHLLKECRVDPMAELNGSERNPEDEKVSAALTKYTETRHGDLVAICDMAMRQ